MVLAVKTKFNGAAGDNLPPRYSLEVRMKHVDKEYRVNNVVYTESEWKRNQLGIYVASFMFVVGFLLLWWICG